MQKRYDVSVEALAFVLGFISGGIAVAAVTELGVRRLAHRLSAR